MEKIVVTRHKALYEYLIYNGYVDSETKVISHATTEDVRGKHVYGVLPMRLASEASLLTEVSMEIPFEKRGVELSVEDIETFHPTLTTYKVEKVWA